MKKLCNTDAELKKSVANKKKRVLPSRYMIYEVDLSALYDFKNVLLAST